MKTKQLKKEIDKLWELHKKDVDGILENAQRLAKKGERYIRDKSKEGKKQLEIVAFNLQREKLYYELGKAISSLPKERWPTSKKPLEIIRKIKCLNIKIAKKRK